MNVLLSGEEHRLPIEEIERILVLRNAPPSTVLFQAHYEPAWLTTSTISLLVSDERAEVALCIWSPPSIVDFEIAENLTFSKIRLSDYPDLADQPQWIEERIEVPQTLLKHIESRMRTFMDLVQPDEKSILDGLMVEANMLILAQRMNHFRDHDPEGLYFNYFWRLCHLAMSCLEEKRSLKYLVALTKWLIYA